MFIIGYIAIAVCLICVGFLLGIFFANANHNSKSLDEEECSTIKKMNITNDNKGKES